MCAVTIISTTLIATFLHIGGLLNPQAQAHCTAWRAAGVARGQVPTYLRILTDGRSV